MDDDRQRLGTVFAAEHFEELSPVQRRRRRETMVGFAHVSYIIFVFVCEISLDRSLYVNAVVSLVGLDHSTKNLIVMGRFLCVSESFNQGNRPCTITGKQE